MEESTEALCECGGLIRVYHSRTTLRHRVQYLKCRSCGRKHGSRRAPNSLAVRVDQLEARLKNLEESLNQHNTTGKAG